MTTQPILSQQHNQISDMLSSSNSFIEPNIIKAQFFFSPSRIYSLEFDQNIQMNEMKSMIEKAAHLRKNSYTLMSECKTYTQYNEEKIEELFPGKKLIIFNLELLNPEETSDETELVLQINMPCPEHNYKFLLYYCFDCGKSICSECFLHGLHKGHKIQDKCFYLLSSKYLVEKMFENWSQMPYEDFQISVNLSDYKNQLNNKIFAELFKLLKQVQDKCNDLIEKYNQINEKSLNNIRNSIRDIKLYYIRALDDYKKAINIEDIVNNEEMFIDFDNTYKEIGLQQKEKFKENLQKFQELNKSISLLVQNLIDNIGLKLRSALLTGLDSQQYEDIERQINLKLIKPVDKEQIMNQISDKKNKIRKKRYDRYTINNFNKIKNEGSKNYETAKERRSMTMDFHPSIINNIDTNNSLNKNESESNNVLDSVNNSYDNMELSHNHLNSISSSNNLASNGRTDRYHAFNDLIGNRMDNTNNMNSSMDTNNFKIDSNLITPEANKIFESNILSNINSTNNLNIRQNQPVRTQTNITTQVNNNQSLNNLAPSPSINHSTNSLNIKLNQGNSNNTIFNNNKDANKEINMGMYEINYPKELKINNSGLNGTNNIIQNKANYKHIPMPNVFQAIMNNQNKNVKDVFSNQTNNDIFNINSNQKNEDITKISSMEGISPIINDRAANYINSNQSNNSIINNFNTATFNNKEEKPEISNPFNFERKNGSSSKNKQIKDNNNNNIKGNHIHIQTNLITSNVNEPSPFLNINNTIMNTTSNASSSSGNNINNDLIIKQNNINNETHIPTQSGEYNTQILQITKTTNNINNASNNSSMNNNIQAKTNVNQGNNLSLASVIARQIIATRNELNEKENSSKSNIKINTIYEESSESESGFNHMNTEKKEIDIRYYLKKGFILCPIPGTNKLKIITPDVKDEAVITIMFPDEIGISYFLENCAYCNMHQKLYITGGKIEKDNTEENKSAYSNKLFVIDLFQTTLDGKSSIISELSPMTYPKIKHSMIGYDDKIYVVGGENSDTVERYDIKTDKWELLNPMICCRSYPNLCINEGYLYAFFGMNKDGYTKNIERLNLTNPEPLVWEMVFFDNPNNVDVRIYGCGIYPIEGLIYFFGGKCMGQDTDEIFFFNPKERLIDRTDAKLKWKESFRENTLFQFGTKAIQISDEKYYGTYMNVLVN